MRDECADGTYRQPVSTLWWLRKRTYFVFVMRELSSIFIAWFVVFLLLMLFAVGRGEAAYQDFLDWAASPVVVWSTSSRSPSWCCTRSPGSPHPAGDGGRGSVAGECRG